MKRYLRIGGPRDAVDQSGKRIGRFTRDVYFDGAKYVALRKLLVLMAIGGVAGVLSWGLGEWWPGSFIVAFIAGIAFAEGYHDV